MIVLLGILALDACTYLRDPFSLIIGLSDNQPRLPAAELPDLRAGDFFTFDDDITHTVSSVGEDRIYWHIGNTFKYETSRSIVFPWLKWSTETTSWETVVENDIGDLWPLTVGNSERYTLRNRLKSETGDQEYTETYDCWIPGTETVTVPAGTFDTFVVACHRFIEGAYFMTSIWYYAPKAGNVVKKMDLVSRQTQSVVELKGYGIPLESLT